jgi:hypothetical protein
MDSRDRVAWLDEGEFLLVERRLLAGGEAHVLLFEPASTLDTGDVRGDRAVDLPERI